MKIGFAMAFNQSTAPSLIAESVSLVEEMGAYSVWGARACLVFP